MQVGYTGVYNRFTPSIATGGPRVASGAGAATPARSVRTDIAGFQAYIDAVNQNGNVNQTKIRAGGADTATARTRIVEGYAAEFVAGNRLENAGQMAQAANALYSDLNSGDPNAKSAATFALVASRYKNAGGNYDNAKLKQVLQKTGNQDLIKPGVGAKDVQTLGAVYQALRRGTLSLDQVYNRTNQDSVLNQSKYERAIAAVQNGDLGSSIEGARGAGNSGNNAGNSGNNVGASGNSVGASGNSVGASGNSVGASGNSVGASGNSVSAGPAVNSADPMTQIMALLQQLMQMLTQMTGGGANAFTGNLGGAGTSVGNSGNNIGGAGTSVGNSGNNIGGAGTGVWNSGSAGTNSGGAGTVKPVVQAAGGY